MAAGGTREGPDISGDTVYLPNAPEKERACKEVRGNHHFVKPTEGTSESKGIMKS